MPDDFSRDQGRNEAGSRLPMDPRPFLAALSESVPLPMLLYSADGIVWLANRAAAYLMTDAEGGMPQVLADDGTNLWTVIAARCDEAAPFFDIRVRLRLSEGGTTDSTLTVLPMRAAQGRLGGATVFVTDVPSERVRVDAGVGRLSVPDRSHGASFEELVTYLGELAAADFVYVAEVDPDIGMEARTLAAWSRAGGLEHEHSFQLTGTPAGAFAGRRLVCVPDDVAQAYPEDGWLAEQGFRSFVGVALTDAAGQRVGILAALWKQSLADVAGTCALVRIVGTKAGEVLADQLAERELLESEQRYGAVFEGSFVPMLLIEPGSTQIVDANPAACRFYGYERDELMTMSIFQIDVLAPENVQAEMHRALTGTRGYFAAQHRLADASIRDVEVNSGPITVGGRPLLYAMVHDVTERKRIEAELERHQQSLERVVEQRTEDLMRANAELQQASVARDMVFADLTQELRTSLQTITGFTEILLAGTVGDLNDEQARQLQMVFGAGKRLGALVSSLIETQRADESELVPEHEVFDTVALVESVVFGLRSFAEEKGLDLELVADERPIPVESDRYRVQKILLNLLSNAIRYTERGSVTVTLAREGEESVLISVADTGTGIPPNRLKALFEGPDAHEPAAGIGLPASRRIAGVLGAELSAESTLGEGSVFTLRLPALGIESLSMDGEDEE